MACAEEAQSLPRKQNCVYTSGGGPPFKGDPSFRGQKRGEIMSSYAPGKEWVHDDFTIEGEE